MPDWIDYVRRRLAVPKMTEARRDKVIRELASEAEEVYLCALEAGASRREALEAVERQFGAWDRLSEELDRQEQPCIGAGIERRIGALEAAALNRGAGGILLVDILRDLRIGLRTLRSRPTLACVAVLTLAIGIGAVSAIFSALDPILLRALPFDKPGDLMFVWERSKDQDMPVSYPDFLDWRAESQEFERLAAYRSITMNLTGIATPVQVPTCLVTAGFLPLLRVEPALGRGFLDEEDKLGAKPVVVLGHRFWRDQFGADPGTVGSTLRLDQRSYTVVGILPAGFSFPPGSTRSVDLFVPFGLHSEPWAHNRTARPAIRVLGRLKAGSNAERAEADLERIALGLERQYPESNTGVRAALEPLHQTIVQGARPALQILAAACGLLLLVACANLASLLLVGASTRQREIAVRLALGARPARIVRQLLIEYALLSLLGGLGGVFIAVGLLRIFSTGIATSLPLAGRVALDGRVLLFTFLLSFVAGLFTGLRPAVMAARTGPRETLVRGGRAAEVLSRGRSLRILVVGEVALALVLLVSAGLLVRSLNNLLSADLGLDPRGVLTARISLPQSRYPEAEQQVVFFRQLLEEASNLPSASSAAVTMFLPLSMNWWENSYHVEGAPPPPIGQEPRLDFAVVSPDYHRTMGIPVVSGRAFDRTDTADSVRVAIVDRRFADRWWPGQDPIGRRFRLGRHDDASNPWWTIVGVAGEVRSRGADQQVPEQVYVPAGQFPQHTMHLAVKSRLDPAELTSAVRRIVRQLDPELPVAAVATMDRYLFLGTSSQRLYAQLMATFAALSLLLSVSGLYGVLSYSVRQRSHEIGVRTAVGAGRGQVLGLVFRQSMTLVILGVVIGTAGALVLTRLMSGLLFGIATADPLTFAAAALLMIAVAAAACLVPAHRAARIDPILALRSE